MNNNSNFLDLTDFQIDYRDLQNECRKKKQFIDVQLRIGDELFDAHRNVISLYSPVLKAMLSEQWSTTKICPISDEHVNAEIMEDLLDFFYTGKIELTPDNVHSVCMAARFLQIPKLFENSVDYLCQLITLDNVLTLYRFSISSDLESLRYFCLQTVKANYETVFQSSQILEFSFNDFNDLIVDLKQIIDCPRILREHTFHCIVRWAEANLPERSNYLPILVKNIPLDELPLDFFRQTVFTHALVKKFALCDPIVSTTKEPQRKQNMIVIDQLNWGNNQQFMNCYDSETGVWRKFTMSCIRSNSMITVVNRKDIIVCGRVLDLDLKETINSFDMFEWNKKTWTKLPEMPISLRCSSMTAHKDHLYVAEREESSTGNGTVKVLCYSLQTQQWRHIQYISNPNKIQNVAHLIAYKEYLYALDDMSTTVEKYDPARNRWTIMANRSKGGVEFAATLHQDKIFVCGLNYFEVYDPETNVWRALPEPPPVYQTSLVSLNDKLLAVGGYREDLRQSTDLIYVYDHRIQIWTKFGKMETEQVRHLTVVGNFY